MKRLLHLSWIALAAVGMAACSSSPKGGEEAAGDQIAATDAGTDSVPQATTEVPMSSENAAQPAPAGETVAATDPAAAPAGEMVASNPDVTPTTGDSVVEPPKKKKRRGKKKPDAAVADATPTEAIGTGQFDSYTVQDGDTLMKIAFETYGDLYKWKNILEANKDTIQDPNRLPKGVAIKVEKPSAAVALERNGEKYLIKKGDTLGTISNDVYGTKSKWKSIWENNKQLIHDPNRIFAGFSLYYLKDDAATSSTRAPASAADGAAPAQPAGQ